MLDVLAALRRVAAFVASAILAAVPVSHGDDSHTSPGPARPLFADEFSGPIGSAPDAGLWRLKVTDEWQPAPELQTYTTDPANAHLDGAGHLVIQAVADDGGWTSARLQSNAFLRYGRFEARMQLPSGAGVWPAFWLLGDDSVAGWPECGEVDIAEVPAAEGGRVFAGTHQPGADGGEVGSGDLVPPVLLSDPGAWHTYVAAWTPGRVELSVDGSVTGVVTREAIEAAGGVWVLDQPARLVLNIAIGGWGGTPGAWSSQSMLVDWVRVTPA